MCTAPRSRLRTCRVALIHAAQNFAQLDDIYGRARHPTIVTNANTHIVLLGTGQEEAVNCFTQRRKTIELSPLHRMCS
ncbi:TraM recognition domain-containing protein [Ktedonospora formicarum]|uniref:TraM recognition domain-containing protein n=1 Tax=Ktedonospora formicarum TaxID=2778364 RepID=UPI001C68CBC0